jgi:hypothetical protein
MPLSTVLAVEVLREKAAARQVKADARTIARRGYRTLIETTSAPLLAERPKPIQKIKKSGLPESNRCRQNVNAHRVVGPSFVRLD